MWATIIIRKTSDYELLQKLETCNEDDVVICNFSYLTEEQAEILSWFKWRKVDLSKCWRVPNESLRILSKFQWEEIDIGWIYNIDKNNASILNSFSENITIRLYFTYYNKKDIERIKNCIKECCNLSLWCRLLICIESLIYPIFEMEENLQDLWNIVIRNDDNKLYVMYRNYIS